MIISAKTVVHLMPRDGIGGVEVAAKSLPTGFKGGYSVNRQYLVKLPNTSSQTGEYHGLAVGQNNPLAYSHALRTLYCQPPDLLVVSLWRSALVLICLKVVRPRLKSVLFLHLASDAHFLDKVVSRLAMRLCDTIWTDSKTTLQHRVPPRYQYKGRVISFLLDRYPLPSRRSPTPNFIFWGRLNYQKRLDQAIEWFAGFLKLRPESTLTIIGPDGGCETALREQVKDLNLIEKVMFKGPMSHPAIQKVANEASFYLQSSSVEGMAISVVEAMQFGLVPVVTPVGEIAQYCKDGENAVFLDDSDAAKYKVLALLEDAGLYWQMAQSAADYWQSKPLYRDDFINAARDILELSSN